jgi:hypothetical protein
VSRRQIVMVGDGASVIRAAEVARKLNEQDATMRTVAAEIGVTASSLSKLMREAGYRHLWVTVEGQCVACRAPNGGGYVTPGCPACVDLKHVAWPKDASPASEATP